MAKIRQLEQGIDHLTAAGMTAVGVVLTMMDNHVRQRLGNGEADELLDEVRTALEQSS